MEGGPDAEAMFILCEFLAAIDFLVYRDLKNRLEKNVRFYFYSSSVFDGFGTECYVLCVLNRTAKSLFR